MIFRASFPLCRVFCVSQCWQIPAGPSAFVAVFSSFWKGYGLPVVCTDCSGSTDSMNVHICPGESQYYAEGLQALDASYHNALSSKERSRKRGAGTTSLLHPQQCNGIASKRMEADGTLYPSNHDRITAVSAASPLLADQHGTPCPVCFFNLAQGQEWQRQGWLCAYCWRAEHQLTALLCFSAGSSQSGAKPSELNNLNLVRASPAGGSLKQLNVLPEIPPTLLDLQSEAEAKQALLANGFTPKSCDSSHALKPSSRSTDWEDRLPCAKQQTCYYYYYFLHRV